MEKEEMSQRTCKTIEPELFLQWGNRKRLRCVRVKDPQKISHKSNAIIRRRITSRLLDKEFSPFSQSNHRLTRNSEAAILSSSTTEHRKAALSPEEEDRYYTTRGSTVGLVDENGKVALDSNNGDDNKGLVWPKLFITLSSKEKEEDFMAMKGCKPSQRPKKRAKIIQRSLLVSKIADLCIAFNN
ncbi:hypothetical protein CRYUN_Cryun05aG0039700 [Craigia yunnanensis]